MSSRCAPYPANNVRCIPTDSQRCGNHLKLKQTLVDGWREGTSTYIIATYLHTARDERSSPFSGPFCRQDEHADGVWRMWTRKSRMELPFKQSPLGFDFLYVRLVGSAPAEP